ncbi:MAG: pantoate--beta-alanine ligase [Halanaerobiales bacterium]|nr:pantoate--beta-alanine ligase [Halanaerobiales bacterium]
MEIIKGIAELRSRIQQAKEDGKDIGLVPTMGYLHEGHLSLVRAAVRDNDIVVVSIFVNPTQFGPNEDYDSYPRDLEHDAAKLRELGVDYVFAPGVQEMYPEGYNSFVEVRDLTDKLCGKSRPGHFRGVTTVVTKLLNIVQPHRAYFGQKDFQQLVVIRRMVTDLNIPVEIKGLPIVREEDGLAMSSRNKYLNSKERKAATVLFKALEKGKEMILEGERDADKVREEMAGLINQEPLARIDYVAVVDPEGLQDLKKIGDRVLLALAVFIGNTRLIDNCFIEV